MYSVPWRAGDGCDQQARLWSRLPHRGAQQHSRPHEMFCEKFCRVDTLNVDRSLFHDQRKNILLFIDTDSDL